MLYYVTNTINLFVTVPICGRNDGCCCSLCTVSTISIESDDSSFLDDRGSPILNGACQRDFYSISTISWNPVYRSVEERISSLVHLAVRRDVASLVFLDFSRPRRNAEETVDDLLHPGILYHARKSSLNATPRTIRNSGYLPWQANEIKRDNTMRS